MPIVIIPRNGPPEAMTCPALLCDACGARIHTGRRTGDPEAERPEDRPGLATWCHRVVDGNGPSHERFEASPVFFVHKGHCDHAFGSYVQQFYRAEDGWNTRPWRDVDEVFRQLANNMATPFEDDPDLGNDRVLYYPPARIVNLLPSESYVIRPKWLVGDPS